MRFIVDYLNGNGTLQESVDKPRFYNDGGTFIMKMLQAMKILTSSKV